MKRIAVFLVAALLSLVLVSVVVLANCPPPQPPITFWGKADAYGARPGDEVVVTGTYGEYARTAIFEVGKYWCVFGDCSYFGNVYLIDVPFDDPCTSEIEGIVGSGAWFPEGAVLPETLTFWVRGQKVTSVVLTEEMRDSYNRVDLFSAAPPGKELATAPELVEGDSLLDLGKESLPPPVPLIVHPE